MGKMNGNKIRAVAGSILFSTAIISSAFAGNNFYKAQVLHSASEEAIKAYEDQVGTYWGTSDVENYINSKKIETSDLERRGTISVGQSESYQKFLSDENNKVEIIKEYFEANKNTPKEVEDLKNKADQIEEERNEKLDNFYKSAGIAVASGVAGTIAAFSQTSKEGIEEIANSLTNNSQGGDGNNPSQEDDIKFKFPPTIDGGNAKELDDSHIQEF